jgi:hypothetical protein
MELSLKEDKTIMYKSKKTSESLNTSKKILFKITSPERTEKKDGEIKQEIKDKKFLNKKIDFKSSIKNIK